MDAMIASLTTMLTAAVSWCWTDPLPAPPTGPLERRLAAGARDRAV
jgi:hypothetical protein